MVKLIVSDIDGTLLWDGRTTLKPRVLRLVRALRERGILFCPASGRQFHSLRLLFGPLGAELPMICENGAVVFGPGEREEECPVLGKTPMPRQDALAIAGEILRHPPCELSVSGARAVFILHPDFGREIAGYSRCRTELIRDPQEIEEDILKVSLAGRGHEREMYEQMAPRWGKRYSVAFSGGDWLDFSLADKGRGLDILCRAYGIDPREVVAFGDNYNDLPILQKVGRGYIMDRADPALRAQVPNRCADVCDVLEQILREEAG